MEILYINAGPRAGSRTGRLAGEVISRLQGNMTKGSVANGAETKGSVTNGAETKGSVTNGAEAKGSVANGAEAKGSVANGAEAKGSVTNSAEAKGSVTRLDLYRSDLPVIDEYTADQRAADKRNNRFDAPVYDWAKQFAAADQIVIAAPFWDMSFPAVLKKYIEAVSVSGITFRYSEEGFPIGLCAAEKLFYVTTAGGPIVSDAFGYGYIKAMATGMYGIRECVCFKAENLDVIGTDVEAVMKQAIERVEEYFLTRCAE